MEFSEFFNAVIIGFAAGAFNNTVLRVHTPLSAGWLIVVPLAVGVTGAAFSTESEFTYYYIVGVWMFIGTIIADKARAHGEERAKKMENQET